jgi:hypothetical protein
MSALPGSGALSADAERSPSAAAKPPHECSDQPLFGKTPGRWLSFGLSPLDGFSKNGVGRTGFEPVTSSVSGKRSPAELTARVPRRDVTRADPPPRAAEGHAHPANPRCALPAQRSTVRLTATHLVPHPSRYPLRWAGRRDPRGRSRGSLPGRWAVVPARAGTTAHRHIRKPGRAAAKGRKTQRAYSSASGSPNAFIVSLSTKRVIAEIRSPSRVSTIIPCPPNTDPDGSST